MSKIQVCSTFFVMFSNVCNFNILILTETIQPCVKISHSGNYLCPVMVYFLINRIKRWSFQNVRCIMIYGQFLFFSSGLFSFLPLFTSSGTKFSLIHTYTEFLLSRFDNIRFTNCFPLNDVGFTKAHCYNCKIYNFLFLVSLINWSHCRFHLYY